MNTIIRQSDGRDAARRVSTTGRTALLLAVILAILSCMAGCDIFDEILNEGKAPAFTAFSFSGQRGTAAIDRDRRTVKATAECGTNLAGVTPQFVLSDADATATANGEEQRSGLTAVDFSRTVTYTLASADGKASATWSVTIELPGDCPEERDAQTPAITAQPQSAAYALNATADALTVTASVSDGGTLSYRWYSNMSNSASGGTEVGTNDRTYTPPTNTAGARYYYVAVTNTNSAAKGAKTATASSAVAAITVTAPVEDPALGFITFATSQTWTVSGNGITQVWSDAVVVSLGEKTAYDGSKSDFRSNPGYKGNLFSFHAVEQHKAKLCPAPWRVPARQDFIDLDKALGGTGTNGNKGEAYRDKYLNVWGGQYSGFCSTTGSLDGQGYAGYYHSQTGRDLTSYAYHMRFISGAAGSVEPDTWNQRYFGYTVRCVR